MSNRWHNIKVRLILKGLLKGKCEMPENYSHNRGSEKRRNNNASSGAPVKIKDVPTQKKRRRRPAKKKSSGAKIAIVAAVLFLLCGSVAAVSLSGIAGGNNSVPASPDNDSPVNLSVPTPPPQQESEASEGPVFEFSAKFTDATSKLPASVKAQLDEDITSGYVVLYDLTEDVVLYEKNGSSKCYPASTTKMMTAAVSSQILEKDDVIVVGDEVKLINWDSSTAGLVKGMKLTYEMLLDALMLPSGNDAAYTIAVNSAKKYIGDDTLSNEEAVKIFMGLVNEAAKDIGCKNTHFVTPDGWHDDDHYTSAEDLARIGAYATSIDIVRNSFSKPYAEWELLNAKDESSEALEDSKSESSGPKYPDEDGDGYADVVPTEYDPDWHGTIISWWNSNALIKSDNEMFSKYCDGIKTGFTDEAGSSVVASATIEGHTLIASVMKGNTLYTKYEDAHKLFKAGFDVYGLKYTKEKE